MSHYAVAWANKQRGLKPTTKVVLWHLANRHNPEKGCFPSQARLAADAELSLSSVNRHLKILEKKGLIKREQRRDPKTRKRVSTRYVLALHGSLGQTPTLSPSNDPSSKHGAFQFSPVGDEPVRRTGKTTTSAEHSDRLLEVAGPGLCEIARCEIGMTAWVIEEWIAEGIDLQQDVVPIVRQRTSKPRRVPIRSWSYFTEAVRAQRDRRLAAEAAAASRRGDGGGAGGATASAADSEQWLADWINGDGYVPPSAVSNSKRDRLLARGLVDEETLRRQCIY